MKNKSRNAVPRKLKEFRYKNVTIKKEGKNIKIRHPAYIIIKKGNKYLYVTLTHSNHVKDKITIKLRKNPNPDDKEESYYIAELKEDKKDSFGKKLIGWILDELDDHDIRKLFNKTKKMILPIE